MTLGDAKTNDMTKGLFVYDHYNDRTLHKGNGKHVPGNSNRFGLYETNPLTKIPIPLLTG